MFTWQSAGSLLIPAQHLSLAVMRTGVRARFSPSTSVHDLELVTEPVPQFHVGK